MKQFKAIESHTGKQLELCELKDDGTFFWFTLDEVKRAKARARLVREG